MSQSKNTAAEVRSYPIGNRWDLRTFNLNGKPVIRGYAALFDTLSEDLGGFREKFDRRAFDGVLGDDVRALVNHDANLILGRRSAGTLRLFVDARGLGYEVTPPDTAWTSHYVEAIRRGDLSGSSLSFFVESDRWERPAGGVPVRIVTKVASLVDVGPVTYPAYRETTAALRSLSASRLASPRTGTTTRRRMLDALNEVTRRIGI